MKRILTAVAAAAVSLGTIAPSLSTPASAKGDSGSQRTLKVASYNIKHGAGMDDRLDLERTASVIKSSGAKVVGLQEVDRHWGTRSDHADEARWLAKRLKMNYCYSPNLDLDPEEGKTERRQYGTAILSAYQLSGCRNTPLTNHPGGEQRGLAQATIKVRGVKVRLLNTHLTHNSQPGRVQQMREVNAMAGQSKMPTVLTADLNATPDAPEYSEFTATLRDVWAAVGDGPGWSYPADQPNRRIDYVLASKDIRPLSANVIDTQASDHLPVIANLALPRR